MFDLDVMLKFGDLLLALGAALFIGIGALVVYLSVKRRHIRLPFYVEAGGVALTVGEERFLEAIARAEARGQSLADLARTLKVDEITAYTAARLLKEKDLITEVVNLDGGSPKFELADPGNDAALARGYIKLM